MSAIAIFDFDHTLITGDSLWPFLGYACGGPRAAAALAKAAVLFACRRGQNPGDPEIRDMRTFIKARLLKDLLAGRRPEQLGPAIEKLRRWQRLNSWVHRQLLDHHAAGHHIVIASGSLDLYLPELLRDIPHHALICTEVEIKDGVITGAMPSGNCVRQRKAGRIAAYLAAHGPFSESWGYGNIPHDLPMLALVRQRIVVG